MTDIEKLVTIRYKDIYTLLDREEAMIQTMENYLKREDEYEFIDSFITQDKDNYKMNMRIRLKN